MSKLAHNQPFDLNEIANTNRLKANEKINETHRGYLGQFMSSSAVSKLLAGMFEDIEGDHRLLDAGAGVGSLTAAFVERVKLHANSIVSTCYEISDVMNHYLSDTLLHCSNSCIQNNVVWKQQVNEFDFIENSVNELLKINFIPRFNKVILNPPYLKISAKSNERNFLKKIGFETGNLYSAFVGLAINCLEDGGELVAITPRSFCNGPYFNDFRKLILDHCSLNKIHIFNNRNSAFKYDRVLQENVIYHLTKGEHQRSIVSITSSSCADDPNPIVFKVSFSDVVNVNNPDRFIHIITNENEQQIALKIGGLPCSLVDLGIQVSTGKVVDFRTSDNLSNDYVSGSVPLIFPQHLKKGSIKWPIIGAKKPNALMKNDSTEKLMVPNGTYVITKRLTSKEEKRRIVASIYSSDIADVEVVGFDNKINYFHALGKPLNHDLAKGLWVFLNSSLVDKYFRQMNGHTQVNASDLRVIRYPSYQNLVLMGKQIDFSEFIQERVDEIVDRVLFN